MQALGISARRPFQTSRRLCRCTSRQCAVFDVALAVERNRARHAFVTLGLGQHRQIFGGIRPSQL